MALAYLMLTINLDDQLRHIEAHSGILDRRESLSTGTKSHTAYWLNGSGRSPEPEAQVRFLSGALRAARSSTDGRPWNISPMGAALPSV